MDFQTAYEGEIWCLCTVTFGPKSLKLNRRSVYCSRLYGIYAPKQNSIWHWGRYILLDSCFALFSIRFLLELQINYLLSKSRSLYLRNGGGENVYLYPQIKPHITSMGEIWGGWEGCLTAASALWPWCAHSFPRCLHLNSIETTYGAALVSKFNFGISKFWKFWILAF